jgi:hypothetical protein
LLHTHLRRYTTLFRRTNGRNLGTLQKAALHRYVLYIPP